MQRRLQAGAQCEDLRFYTPHFYRVGAALCALGLDERVAEVLMGTWRVRYKQLLVPSLRGDSRHDSVELMSKLTLEEQRLFEAGHGGVLGFERYRATRPLMQRYVCRGHVCAHVRYYISGHVCVTGLQPSSASGRSRRLGAKKTWRWGDAHAERSTGKKQHMLRFL